jgi:hypothetical protein
MTISKGFIFVYKHQRFTVSLTSRKLQPNAGAHLPPEAGAQRTLEAVGSSGLFGMLLLKRDSEGWLAFQPADLQDGEANDLPGLVDFFHHGIVVRLSEISLLMGK